MERIGLIAGSGELPVIFAREARKKGTRVIGFAIKEMADLEFDSACDRVHRLGIGQVKKFFFLLLIERIKKVVMLGKVDKSVIYDSKIKMDKKAAEFLNTRKGKSDYGLLDGITAEFEKVGIRVVSGLEYLSELLPSKGVLTKRKPVERENEDIAYGFGIAKEIARMDVGQTVIVKDKAVIAVEAMDGTDRVIERAGRLSGGGFSVIKVSRPNQDMRWDVPVVGPDTVNLIAKNKGNALAIEEKKMFLIHKESCLELADSNNISLVVL